MNVPHRLNIVSSTTNESWRTRNNLIKTNFSGVSRGTSLRMKRSVVDDVLKDQQMQTGATKSMIKSLLVDKNSLEKSQHLI